MRCQFFLYFFILICYTKLRIIPKGDFMEGIRLEIENKLLEAKKGNECLFLALNDKCLITDYANNDDDYTEAFQRALNEHEVVVIPSKGTPYMLSGPVLVPSNRRIIAENGATVRLSGDCKLLMLRNTSTADGTHMPITAPRNENISIEGGVWEEMCPYRLGYGNSGMYDSERSFFGVSTCMLLENINHLTLRNMTFRHCGGFGVQIGECNDVIIENIFFDNCFADGVHVNGNVENIHIKNVYGEVGDDLVAFNMFDWQNSSINFGPCKNVLCEDLELFSNSFYKALRIEPGIYTFDDGSTVDCSLNNAIFRRIKGIKTFKLYCQTPVYSPTIPQERADVGSGDNIFFEDIKIDLDGPIDLLDGYVANDAIKGSFAGFELGLNAKNLYIKNVDITLYREKYPYSYLICIGPKSARGENGIEFFDPCFSSVAENVYLEGITINGKAVDDISPYVKEIEFNNLYDDILATGYGKIKNLVYKK